MARQSFRLRRSAGAGDSVGVGSFLRGTDALQQTAGAISFDQDSAIRSTGIIATIPTVSVGTFEASAIEHNAVLLSWELSDAFTALEDIGTGESGLLSVLVVYSKTGYPQTVLDGKVIFEGATSNYLHQESYNITTDVGTITVNEPESGQWAFYTLFGYFNNDGVNGDYFYERLSSLQELVPYDWNSKQELWKKIPFYYRDADSLNNNQLERFLDMFGFEIDRTRTLINNLMVQYDPQLSSADVVDQLAKTIGLELSVTDIGVSKVRALLNDIGILRRTKGTLSTTEDYLTAVSGSNVTTFTGASAPYYTFAVHAERINLVANPRFVGSVSWNVASEYSVTTTSASSGITITAGGADTKVAIRSTVGVPVQADTVYYMSADITGASAPNVVYGGLWHTGASWNNWSGVTAAADEVPMGIDNRFYYEMDTVATTGTYYPVFVMKLKAGQAITFKNWMVEPNRTGGFFDGDSVFGGYLYQGFSSDYRWFGTSYASYSIYTTDRKRTQNAITKLLPQILPVTMLGVESGQPKYQVQFDWIPGRTL
jgi:hypothetical protein